MQINIIKYSQKPTQSCQLYIVRQAMFICMLQQMIVKRCVRIPPRNLQTQHSTNIFMITYYERNSSVKSIIGL